MAEISSHTATIAVGASKSGVFNIGGFRALALVVPVGFTATTVTFLTSPDGTGDDAVPIYDDTGVEASATVAAGQATSLATIAAVLAPFQNLLLRSGTSGSPVNQATAATRVTILLKG